MKRQGLTFSVHLKMDQTIVLKESNNTPIVPDFMPYCFVFIFIKFGSLKTEKSFCLYTDLCGSFAWSLPLAGFLMYMLSLSCSQPAWLYK